MRRYQNGPKGIWILHVVGLK